MTEAIHGPADGSATYRLGLVHFRNLQDPLVSIFQGVDAGFELFVLGGQSIVARRREDRRKRGGGGELISEELGHDQGRTR